MVKKNNNKNYILENSKEKTTKKIRQNCVQLKFPKGYESKVSIISPIG